ncbi:flagellar biosynthesis protein FlgA [Arthrobacter cheniae]|uniref:Flagellar biosynthesis protein FlgA n=1 Tax=Arthrobacter cheniae TaxID=1258888 RepID=A0A3A5M038_9MICC|nr:RcpC/CpaB family pilus assembly protein [Arthrobacter cheniae]RJT78400.1 flagellar biosynthesis protein FlgA [Arthrobacter cheniae]
MNPTGKPHGPPLRHRLRRTVHRRKRLIAALLFSAAAGVAVEAAVGDDYATTTVVSATRDLAVGTILQESDVTVVRLPEQAVAIGAADSPADVVGQQVATPLPEGAPVSATSLVGDSLLTGTPPGTVAVPLRPADPATVQLLAPGQLVDVILRTGNGYDVAADSSVLAQSVAILWTDPGDPGAWPGGGEGGLVVIAASPEDAAALAGSSSSGDVHLVLTAR